MIEIKENFVTIYCTKYHWNWEAQYDVDIVETHNTFELLEDLKREFQKILPNLTLKETYQIVDKKDWVIYDWPIECIELNKTFIILYL